jgi:hypothetical protein
MCPLCITTTVAIITGATSTGGLTAFVVKHLRAKLGENSTDARAQTKHQKQESKNAVYQDETKLRSAA